MINVQINQEAYDAIKSMRFDILYVLKVFGTEVWENNPHLYEKFTEEQVATAFIQHILDQCEIAKSFNPMFI